MNDDDQQQQQQERHQVPAIAPPLLPPSKQRQDEEHEDSEEEFHHDPTQSPTRIKMNRGFSIEDNIATMSLEMPDTDNTSRPQQNHHHDHDNGDNITMLQSHSQNYNHHPSLQQQPQPQQNVNNATSGTSGSGRTISGWLEKQREKRRREKLQLEAERQLQIIKEATAANHHHHGHHGDGNDGSHSTCNLHDHHHHGPLQDEIGGGTCSPHGNDHIGPVRSRSTSSNSADHEQHDVVRKMDISKSGEGASVYLDLSEVLGDSFNSEEEELGEGEEFPVPAVRIQPVKGDSDNPFILNPDQMHAIASHVLPKTIAFCKWKRLYGLNRDGDSFDACVRIIGTVQRTLLVIRTSKGDIFGGYADTPWHSNDRGGSVQFYGSAAACLFSFSSSSKKRNNETKAKISFKYNNDNNENSNVYSEKNGINRTTSPSTNNTLSPAPASSKSSSYINVYRWTGKNRYIQLCDLSNKKLAFGGGGDDGAFGLCVQDDFQRGSTGPCDTFDNDPLCDGQGGSFDIVDVEFWEFLTGMF